ncbi:MAG TPA: fibronectin type III domain-containing protein [Mycobacteriales bacterium]
MRRRPATVPYGIVALASTAALVLVAPTPAVAAPGDQVTLLTGGGVLDGRTAERAAVDAVRGAQLADGSILVADAHRRIRLIDGATGVVSTVAGSSARTTGPGATDADLAANGDGGPATSAKVTSPTWVDRRADGTTVFVDGRRIRAVDAGGTVTTIAGTGAAGPAADGPDATAVALDPTAVALDRASGDLYVGDRSTRTVRVVRADGSVQTVVGGGATTGVVDAPATDLRIAAPSGLALMPDASLLVREGRYLWHVTGGQASRVGGASSAWARAPRDGAPVLGAALPATGPGDLAVSPDGTVSLADSAVPGRAVVRQFQLGGTISFRRNLPCATVVSAADDRSMLLTCGEVWRATTTGVTRIAGGSSGRATVDTSPDGTPGREAAWSSVLSPVSDGAGHVWFATGYGATVLRYDDADGQVHLVAGTGTPGTGTRTDGAVATGADLGGRVNSLALLPGGRLAVASDRRVSIVEPDGTLTFLTDVAATTLRYTDGMPASAVRTFGRAHVAATPAGTLLVETAGVVLEVALSDRTVTVRGGNPLSWQTGNGLAARQTNLGWVRALAPYGDGEVAVLTGSRHGTRAVRVLQADGRVGTLARGLIGGIAPTADGGLLVAVARDGDTYRRGLVKIAVDRSVALVGTGGATLADDAALDGASPDGASLDEVQLAAEPTGVVLASHGRLRRATIADLAATGTVPAAPTGLTAVPASDGRSVRVDWTAPTGTPDRIEVHADATGAAAPSGLAQPHATLAPDATGYTVTGLTPGAKVTVSAFAGAGEFARSVPATATVVMPGDTRAPRLYDVRIGAGKTVPVSWFPPLDGDTADVVVVTRTDRLPADPADGTVAYTGLLGPVTLDAPARPESLFVGVFVRDWSGNVARVRAQEVTPALPPAPVVTSPTAAVSTGTDVAVTWRTVADPWGGTPTYEVAQSVDGGAWSEPEPTTGTTLTYPADTGHSYCHRVRAVGADGATGPWSATRCTAVPLDDTELARSSGWSTVTGSTLYGGSARRTAVTGATLTASRVTGTRVALVASTCSTCGTVGVYVNNRLVGSVSLASRRSTDQTVVYLPARTMSGATVTLKVLSRNRSVTVDGLAVLR